MVNRRSSSPPPRPRTKTLDGLPRPRSRPSFPSPARAEGRELGRRTRLSSPPSSAPFKTTSARRTSSRPELEPVDSLFPPASAPMAPIPAPQIPAAPAAPRLELEPVDSLFPPAPAAPAAPRLELEPVDSLFPPAPAAPATPRLELEPVDPYPDAPSLGEGEQIPRVLLDPSALQGLDLDHRAGFLLSLIDGMTSVDDLMELSGMPREDVEQLLLRLLEVGAITLS